MDDTTWCLGSVDDLPSFLLSLFRASSTSKLFSSVPKQLRVVATRTLHEVQFVRLVALMGNTLIKMHSGPGYVHVVGRHLMPHVYHRVDKIKLFLSSRKASAVLRTPELPASFPLHIHSGAIGGQHRWHAAVLPPNFSATRVNDHAAPSAIRGIANWDELLSVVFFHPVEAGWTGLQPAGVSIISTFLLTYLRPLQHAIELVRSSTLHSLFTTRRSMHPDMPGYQPGLKFFCRSHNTDHNRALAYVHFLGISVYLPDPAPPTPHPGCILTLWPACAAPCRPHRFTLG